MPWPSPPGPRPPHLVWSEASPPRAGTQPEARVRPARRKQPRRGWSPPHAERRLSLSEYYPPRIQKVSIDNDGYAMPATTTILLFALATFLLTVSPGPGVLYVTARSLAQGRRAGFASMFGIEFGEVVWIAAAATGVAALLSASAAALDALRLGGAAYLVYLGIQRWRQVGTIQTPQPARIGRIFLQGVVTQLLNPKVAVFFVAFLPQFLNPAHAIPPQVIVLGIVYVAVAIAVDTTYVLTAAAVSRRFMRSRVAQVRTGRVAAATYVALGLAAAASGFKRP